ncbi:MAG: YesU family protein [Candidatus Pacebacteria bacterium]|nr:YesU family protein [Candidatus Paceibacterota bacterium]
MEFTIGSVLYENPLASGDDIEDFRLEGDASITFPRGRMRLEQAYERDMDKGLHANFVLWCPEDVPSDIAISWEFQPHSDAGLAMIWFAAGGRNGEDLFDANLQPRGGDYPQYHHGDMNAYQKVSSLTVFDEN